MVSDQTCVLAKTQYSILVYIGGILILVSVPEQPMTTRTVVCCNVMFLPQATIYTNKQSFLCLY